MLGWGLLFHIKHIWHFGPQQAQIWSRPFVSLSVQIVSVSAAMRFLALYGRRPKLFGWGLYVRIKQIVAIWHHGPQQATMRSRPAGVESTPTTLTLGNFLFQLRFYSYSCAVAIASSAKNGLLRWNLAFFLIQTKNARNSMQEVVEHC